MKQQSAKIRESSTVPILEINYRKQTKKKKDKCSQNIQRSGGGGKISTIIREPKIHTVISQEYPS